MLRPFAVLALVVVTSPAAAQDSWPSKPITVIVPFGAGGNTDSLARIYSARLSARLGQQLVIENRVGAGSIIGITSLAKAAPDGYTIGVGTSAGLAINPAIMKENLGYNADKDFAYLHLMAIQPNLLVVHPSVPARSLTEFIAWAKANPNQAYATSGNGSSQHLCGEMLMQAAGIKMTGVAYRASNSPAARSGSLAITSRPPGNRSRLGKSVHSPSPRPSATPSRRIFRPSPRR